MDQTLSPSEMLEMMLSFAMNLLDGKNCTGAGNKPSKSDSELTGTGNASYDSGADLTGQSKATDEQYDVDFEADEHAEYYENSDGVVTDDADGDGVEDTQIEMHPGDFESAPDNVTRKDFNLMKAKADLCFRGHDFQLLVTFVAPAAVLTVIVLSLLIGKHKKQPLKAIKFAIWIPMNVLNSYSGKVRFTLATVLMAYPSFQLIRGIAIRETFGLTMPMEVKPLFNLAAWLGYGMCLYPIFGAIAIQSAISTLVGIIYAVAVFAITIVSVMTCDDIVPVGQARIVKEMFARFPTLLCSVLLVVLFVYDLVMRIKKGAIFGPAVLHSTIAEPEALQAKMQYLKTRCMSKTQVVREEKRSTILCELYRIICRPVEGFYYPTKLLCAVGCCVSVLYYSTYFLVRFSQYLDTMDNFIESIEKKLKVVNDDRSFTEVMQTMVVNRRLTLPCAALALKNAMQLCHYWIEAVRSCYIASIPFTLVYHLLLLRIILVKYREHMLAAYKGQHTAFHQCTAMAPASMTLAFIKFSGFQLAHFVVSLMIVQVLFWVIFAVLGFGVVMPLVFGYTDTIFINLIKKLWATILIGILITFGINYVTRFVFVADKGKMAGIVRRDWFFVWGFFVFMTSTIVGLVGCIIRVIKSIIFTSLFLARLDWTNLPPEFVSLDKAYSSYCGQLRFDEYHSHPALIVFASIMDELKNHPSKVDDKTDKGEAECGTVLLGTEKAPSFRVSKRARTRWFLLFTLHRNPSLVLRRKHRLNKPQKTESPGLLQKLTSCCKKPAEE